MASPANLAPELRNLSEDARSIWGHATARQRAFEDLLTAWDMGDVQRAEAAIKRIDRAVAEGLEALRLPRGVDAQVQLVERPGWLARWDDTTHTIALSVERVHGYVVRLRQPDSVFRAWVHESLHARQRFSPNARWEYRSFNGYEEGLVEGLADLLVRRKAGMEPAAIYFAYHVSAYRALAAELAVDVELLWRASWTNAPGNVRTEFVNAVASLKTLNDVQPHALQAIGDQVFASVRQDAIPNEGELRRLWKHALA
jgi:hypothetical protein